MKKSSNINVLKEYHDYFSMNKKYFTLQWLYMVIDRKYIVDEDNQRTAVLLDIATFEEIEDVIENAALFTRMRETDNDDTFDIGEARSIYARLRSGINADKGD